MPPATNTMFFLPFVNRKWFPWGPENHDIPDREVEKPCDPAVFLNVH